MTPPRNPFLRWSLRHWVAVSLGFGLLLRFVHMLTLGNRYFFGDTPEYQSVALRMLHGLGLSEGGPRAPLYPAFMAFSFLIGGEDNFRATRLLQLGLSLVLMLVVVRLARRIGGDGAAAAAAPIIALAPTILFVSGLLYPTLVYSLLLAAVVLTAWELSERPSVWSAGQLALYSVLGWLTDMVILAPLLAIGTWLLFQVNRRGAALARMLLLSGVLTAMLIAPYLSYMRSHSRDSVFMAKAQAVLHFARTDTLISTPRLVTMPFGTPFEALTPKQFLHREARLFLAHPGPYLHDLANEFLHFFQPIPDRITTVNRYNTSLVLFLGGMYFVVLLTVAVLGLVFGAGPLRARVLLALVIVSTAAFYSLFFTQARYRIPVEPMLVVLAALGVARAFPRFTALFHGGASEDTRA
jgi:hypothetical protein